MVLRPCEEYGSYTMDNYPQNGGGGHHFYESIKTEMESFRLRGADGNFSASVAATSDALLSDDTSSIASKKRIDSMFKTTASAAGDTKRTSGHRAGRQTQSLADDKNHYDEDVGGGYFDYGYAPGTNDRNNNGNNNNNKNTVQEKIEKMFAEISSSELDTDVSMDSSAVAAETGSNKFHVQYIGCAGLSGKISSLEGLQKPVRDMYFGYRENQHHYRGGGIPKRGYYDDEIRAEARRDFSGLLEISAAGLTIRYRNGLGDTEQRTNAFPSIAVWAALKYVCRRRSPPPQRRIVGEATTTVVGYEYAFLPLIADPDGSDKAPLFRDMDAGDRARLDAAGDHAPVFAVVTRAAGKRLECHGFACETENDALLMAANLYGALVTAMSSAAAAVDVDAPMSGEAAGRRAAPSARRVIRQRNGFTSMSSTAGSSVAGGGVGEEAPALPPPRPPRRNKKSTSSVSASTSAGDDGRSVPSAMTSVRADDGSGGDVCSGAKTFQLTVKQPPSLQRGVCNSSSAAGLADMHSRSTRQQRLDGGGDILTKVAIPRSRSFLNSNGLASTKYSRRAADCGIETAAADRRRRRSNGSGVMGFSDMFNEMRAQEGLNNMDDILNAIINVEGMSYNDLKPIYKEFLMKLALTLTKDELYQRTKAIMTEQKRKRNKRRPAVATQAAGRGRRFNDKLRDAFNFRAAKSRIGSVLLPDFCKRKNRNSASRKKHQLVQQHQQQQQKRRRCSCSIIAGSSTSPADRKPERKFQRRVAAGKRSVVTSAKKGRRMSATSSSPVCSTSDDSDFFAAAAMRQRQHQQLQQQLLQQLPQLYKKTSKKRGGGGRGTATASEAGCLHRASSGYFSCSECSGGGAIDDDGCSCCGDGAMEPTTSLVSCSCDSDSCAESDKCYCGRPRRPRNIFDELKSRGFAASESSVSRADSPGTAWKKNELLMLLQQRHDDSGPGMGGESSPATAGGGKCGIEPSKSIEYLQMTHRARPSATTTVAGAKSTAAAGSSSSPSSSLSAATVYSSSSAVHQRRPQPSRGAKHHHRRSGSSGSDNFRAIDYALFAATADGAAGPRKTRGCGGTRQNHRRPDGSLAASSSSVAVGRRSYSSEAVHMTGCRVQYGGHARQPALPQQKKQTARRHSVHDGGGDDVLSTFFKSGIENSLGYYP
ncbi:uncharacterized protein LOC132941461 [Metopolophium dirhodum]|uniref:uncharacterized protein LOC132941461 n=1 Tax=Metopolophium dirhodum TaxID=44670 RepID=UPI00298FE1E3|nr:uncharacterized protein LOC132941461 [Metopolophium dirhodum]